MRRKSLVDYQCELNKHNFSRVLREIEVRGAYHHAGKLGKWEVANLFAIETRITYEECTYCKTKLWWRWCKIGGKYKIKIVEGFYFRFGEIK